METASTLETVADIAPTLDNFTEWLWTFNRDAIVGFAWSLQDCPVIRWGKVIGKPDFTSWPRQYGETWAPIVAKLVDCFPGETPISAGTVLQFVRAIRETVVFYAPTLTNKE